MEDTKLVETAIPPTPAAADAAGNITSRPDLDLDKLTLAEITDLYEGRTVDVPLKPGVEGKTTQEAPPAAAPAVDPPADDTPPAVEGEQPAAEAGEPVVDEPVTEAPPDDDPLKPVNRPRLDEREQLIMGVYKRAQAAGKPITLAAAEAMIDGLEATATPVVEAAPAVDHTGKVATIEGELATLQADLRARGEELSNSDRDALMEQITDKKLDLRDAQRDVKAADAADRASSNANRSTSHAEALAAYPDINDLSTPLGKDVAAYVEAIKNPNHPDHNILWADSSPMTIAATRASKLGILPKQVAKTPPAPPAKAKVVAPPRVLVSPAPGNKTAAAPAEPEMDGKQAVEYVKTEAPLDLLDKIQGGGDQGKLLAAAFR